MPDHPHARFARTLWTAVASGEAEAVRACLSDDVIWEAGGDHPLSGTFRGPDAVLDYLATVGEQSDELRTEFQDVFVNERGAVVVYHISARRELHRLETDIFLELIVSEGKLVRARSVTVDQSASHDFWS
jgi:ketosteroid isomerase-like protein